MNLAVKERLSELPLIGSLGPKIVNYWRAKSDEKIIRNLGKISHPVANILNKALRDLKERNLSFQTSWVEHIENERKRLLINREPLIDGAEEHGGLYDRDVTIQEACKASRDSYSAIFLYLFTRALQPNKVIELGTNLGISSAYIAAALKDRGNDGRLVTLDASPYRQKLAREVHQNVGLQNIEYEQGLFYDTLEPALRKMGKIDLAFIDGHHQYQPTLDYFEVIIDKADFGTVLIFDDIRYSDGMKQAWKELRQDKRFDLIVDLKDIGICSVNSKTTNSKRFVIPTIHNALKNSKNF